MDYLLKITPIADDPKSLETVYRQSVEENQKEEFQTALEKMYEQQPGNLLLAAWHYRLSFESLPEAIKSATNWTLVILLSITTGLVFWLLSDENFSLIDPYPAFVHLWAPVAILFIIAFFTAEDSSVRSRALWAGGGLTVVTAYGLVAARLDFGFVGQYADLLLIHVPFLSWTALGLTLLNMASDARSRFAFLRKSLEMFVTGGLYLIAGVIFGGITIGMFDSLSVSFPDILIRLIAAGGVGLLPIIAVASVYEPRKSPVAQSFGQGVGKLVPVLTQLLLPLSLVVLIIFIAFIPFNFDAPFRDRGVLIVYNLMLFAIMGLLLGVTPIHESDLSPTVRPWIRRGIIAVASLAALVSLYALAAVVTRTIDGGWTINRLTVIGWNSVNIGLLLLLVFRQIRRPAHAWVAELKEVFSIGSVVYTAWVLVIVILFPILF